MRASGGRVDSYGKAPSWLSERDRLLLLLLWVADRAGEKRPDLVLASFAPQPRRGVPAEKEFVGWADAGAVKS